MARPIDIWPPVRGRGAPGYSARHFAAVSPPSDDPLRVAERIAYRQIAESVHAESKIRLDAGEDFSTVLEWQSRELGRRKEDAWHSLCGSLGLVLEKLESVPPTPGILQLIKVAKRAHRTARRQ